jgi:general secretion pathway protein G
MYCNDRAMKLARGGARTARRSAKAGYSLLEILIVLAIIALIAALVGPRLFAQLDHAKVTTARVQVKSLETALQTMEIDIGRYPTESEGLALLIDAPDRKAAAGWNGPYLSSGVPNDPWGHPYVYEPPTDRNHPPRVHSLGADGKPGGEGDAADIYADTPAGPAAAGGPAQGASSPSESASAPPDNAPKTP